MKELDEKLEEKIDGFTKVKVFPQLYAKASTGKIKTWQTCVVEQAGGTATIFTFHGYIDGKITFKPKNVLKGKNLGKSNETNPFQQACSDARSTFNKKVDKKYIEEIPSVDYVSDILLPMLAQKIKEYLHKIIYPCMTQVKLNGVRCLSKKISETEINYTSRNFKSYNNTLFHLTPYLLPIMEIGEIFDGEIYLHGWTFQKILRHVKKLRPDTPRLQYWIYDVANKETAIARNAHYKSVIPADHSHLIAVPTNVATDYETIERQHKYNISGGFEGTIIRNANAYYKFDYRSTDLLKMKDFLDAEFEIVGFEVEIIPEVLEDKTIVEHQAVIFVCEVPGVGTFTVRPRGSVQRRVRWYNDRLNLLGKPLTVRYAELTEDGLPFHGVGLAIRDYE